VETANVGKIFIMQSGEEKKKNVSTNLLQCGGRVLLEVSKWVLVVGWKNTEHSLGGGRRYLCSMKNCSKIPLLPGQRLSLQKPKHSDGDKRLCSTKQKNIQGCLSAVSDKNTGKYRPLP
jgi:hypothetical protein